MHGGAVIQAGMMRSRSGPEIGERTIKLVIYLAEAGGCAAGFYPPRQ